MRSSAFKISVVNSRAVSTKARDRTVAERKKIVEPKPDFFFWRVRFGGLLERWRFVARLAALGLAGRQENDVRPIVGHQPPTFPSPSRPRSSSPISSELEILPPCP